MARMEKRRKQRPKFPTISFMPLVMHNETSHLVLPLKISTDSQKYLAMA
jgi:hypothetical protein